jgi:hypothetical protein
LLWQLAELRDQRKAEKSFMSLIHGPSKSWLEGPDDA